MNVLEISETIHGELPYMGYPCTLVRFKECNLTCFYCDADLKPKCREMTVKQIVEEVEKLNQFDVLLTGGEPLLQGTDLIDLIQSLHPTYRVAVETNGTIDPKICRPATVVMDVKLFDKKLIEQASKWLGSLAVSDVLKFVYWDEESFSRAWNFIHHHHRKINCSVVFSPVYPDKVYLNSFISRCHQWPYLSIRIQTQIHKILGAV